MRRVLAALVIATTALPLPAGASVPVLVIDGRGFGHGVGMAQDGALWMGRAGASTTKILTQFYPGTKLGKASGTVRVPVLDAPAERGRASAVVAFPNGGEIRDAPGGGQGPGFPLQVPAGGEVRIVFEQGRYHAERTGGRSLGRLALASARRQIPPLEPPTTPTPTTGPPPTTPPAPTDPPPAVAPPGQEPPPPPSQPQQEAAGTSTNPLWAVPAGGGTVALPARQRRYRGVIHATAAGGGLRLVNQLGVEQYLKGMGEVLDPSWPPAALAAQAIAARTYALRAMAGAGEICDTQHCQVYLGAQAEYRAMNRAVDGTASKVLLFGRGLASAVYSANGGGFSASQEEGFGWVANDASYLRPAAYPTKDPLPWNLTASLREVGARLGYPGRLTGARVTRTGPSGRALEVTLEGSAGPRKLSGIAFDAGLGLRSTLFSLRVGAGEATPLPPADDAPPQGPAWEVETAGGEAASVAEAAPLAEAASAAAGPPAPAGLRMAARLVAAWSLLAVVGMSLVMRSWWAPVTGTGAGGGPDALPARPRRAGRRRRSNRGGKT